jgi:hypothetical protein
MLLVIGVGWTHVQSPWWDRAADLREMRDNMATAVGYEGTDEYIPIGADRSAVDTDSRRVTVDGSGSAHAAIRILSWNAESKLFSAEMSEPANVAVRLFNYPAWRVEDNGRVVQAGAREGAGQMLIPLEAGSNRVQITFVRTWDRKVGGWISIISALAMIFWLFLMRISPRIDVKT